MTCESCVHWQKIDVAVSPIRPSPLGRCRRHPPRISDKLLNNPSPVGIAEATVWPITYGAHGCGEQENRLPC
jgi:hypothetical protein